MVLAVQSNESYLSKNNTRSRAGGHHYLSENVTFPQNNNVIINITEIIKAVMPFVVELKLGVLYINACNPVETLQILTKMGHPQLEMPVQTNNLMAEGIINSCIHQKCTKAMDMQFHWLQTAVSCRSNSDFFGGLAPLIMATMEQSTTLPPIFATCVQSS